MFCFQQGITTRYSFVYYPHLKFKNLRALSTRIKMVLKTHIYSSDYEKKCPHGYAEITNENVCLIACAKLSC